MKKYVVFIFLSVFLVQSLFAQDLITKNDNSKIQVKIIEINSTEIKYKQFNNLDGPVYILPVNQLREVAYQNGTHRTFITVSDSIPKKRDARVGDYIKFNVQLGVELNNAYSNLERQNAEEQFSHTSSTTYSITSSKINSSINIGFNFLFGSNKFVKHIIGVNYLRSKGEFYYSQGLIYSDASGAWVNHSKQYYYNSKVDFLNILTGIRFTVFKRIHIEPCFSLNQIINTSVKITGTEITDTYYSSPSTTPPNKVVTTYNNYYTNDRQITTTASFCPRLAYDFNVKQQKLGAYLSYNIAFGYRLPWWMFGVSWYPFKKLK